MRDDAILRRKHELERSTAYHSLSFRVLLQHPAAWVLSPSFPLVVQVVTYSFIARCVHNLK